MTKKHFRALAQAIFVFNTGVGFKDEDTAIKFRDLEKAIADVCAESNPNFDRAKFLNACENGLRGKR